MDRVFERYYNLSLRFISYRSRSEKEVIDYLKKKLEKVKFDDNFDPEKEREAIIAKIMQKLSDYKFINDLEFAKFWIEQRTRIKPKALNAVKFELVRKGVSKDLIEQAMEELGKNKNDDLENAKKLAERKLLSLKNVPKEKRDQRIAGFLQRRGFDYHVIKQVLNY